MAYNQFRGAIIFACIWFGFSDSSDAQGLRTLAPAQFPELPPAIRSTLESQGCRIPQPPTLPETPRLQNVIRGEFQQKGRKDWAVLCEHRDRSSSLLVFRNGSAAKPSVVTKATAAQNDCWVVIAPVGERFITQHYRAYGGPKPPPIDHQGIDYGLCEKASIVFYFHRGRWLQLTGSD